MTDPKPTHRVLANPAYAGGDPVRGDFVEGDLVYISPGTEPDDEGDYYVKGPRTEGVHYYIGAASLEKLASVDDFPVGTRVRVAYPAGLGSRGPGGVFFGEAVDAVVIASGSNSVSVQRVDGARMTQYVGPRYLTKLDEPEEDVAVIDVPAATVTVASLREALRLSGSPDSTAELFVAAVEGLDSRAA